MINQMIQLNDEIIMKDLDGNEFVVARMYCNITAGRSYNITVDILRDTAFNANIEECKAKCTEFKQICEQKAMENGVVIF